MKSLVESNKKNGYKFPDFIPDIGYVDIDGESRRLLLFDRSEVLDDEKNIRSFSGCIIGVPSRDNNMDKEFALRLLTLSMPPNMSSAWDMPSGFEVGDARNRIIARAKSKKTQYVFFIDDDVLFPGNAFATLYKTMISTNAAIVSGLYYTKGFPSWPLVFRGYSNASFRGWRKGDIVEVTGCGMGLTLIDMRIFENPEITEPYFYTTRDSILSEDGTWVKQSGTEDLYFLAKVIKAGYRVLVDTNVFAMHRDKSTLQNYPLENDKLPEMGDKEIIK